MKKKMKQVAGQQNIFDYIADQDHKVIKHCGQCVCQNCLYWWSSRCPYGSCYDDHRAKTDPFDKAHPERTPRKLWSDWNKPGEQAHWCRGGASYPVSYCQHFVKYAGQTVEECIDELIQVFQDGHIICSMKDAIGCEECIARLEGHGREQFYNCQYMTEVGCEAHINALAVMAEDILNGGLDQEMCGEQCCIGCTKRCGYRCGQVNCK